MTRPAFTRPAVGAVLAALLAGGTLPATAQSGGPGGPGSIELPGLAEGHSVGEVRIVTEGAPAAESAALAERARRAFGFAAGVPFNAVLADVGLGRVRALEGVRDAAWRLVRGGEGDAVALELRVVAGVGASVSSGVLAPSGSAKDFPVLYKDERTLARVTLNGGVGLFSEGNPWFGRPGTFTRLNPLVAKPAQGAGTGGQASWFETYVEYGLGGATRVGDSPFYVYGAISGISTISAGRDLFRANTRSTTDLEKLYGGVIYAPADSDLRISASVGRQNFTLNDGFLISQYGSQSNAGPRPGLGLAPRTTHDMTALVTAKWGSWVLKGFYLDPNEYEPIESNTRLVGANLRYNIADGFHVDGTVMHVPNSDTRYPVPAGPALGREGLTTYAGHVRWANRAMVPGLWLEAELAHQTHERFPMSAWAGYGQVGYLARDLPWTPSLSYRYAAFGGDDPSTARYERYDPIWSGGLNEWLQGITINKVLSQANRTTHRVRLNVTPREGTHLTLDWFIHRASSVNNRGGNPAIAALRSADLGQEWQLILRSELSRNFYFVGVGSVALPGAGLREAAGGSAKPWTSLQAQLYWFL